MNILKKMTNSFLGALGVAQPPWHANQRFRLEELSSQTESLYREILGHLQNKKTEAALESCRWLIIFLDELAVKRNDPLSQFFIANSLFDMGACYRWAADDDNAEDAYKRAMEIWRKLAETYAGDPFPAKQIAACKNHLGILFENAQRFEQANQFYLEALDIRNQICATCPADQENRVYLGGTLCNLGNVASAQENFLLALERFRHSIETLDGIIPGCTCGCRDLHAQFASFATGQRHWIMTAQEFLQNALNGRAEVLMKQPPNNRHRYFTTTVKGDCMIAKVVPRRFCASNGDGAALDLRELKFDVLDLAYNGGYSLILDFADVQEMDADAAMILVHLQERVLGMGEEVILCGVSQNLDGAGSAVEWQKLFSFYGTAAKALDALGCCEAD